MPPAALSERQSPAVSAAVRKIWPVFASKDIRSMYRGFCRPFPFAYQPLPQNEGGSCRIPFICQKYSYLYYVCEFSLLESFFRPRPHPKPAARPALSINAVASSARHRLIYIILLPYFMGSCGQGFRRPSRAPNRARCRNFLFKTEAGKCPSPDKTSATEGRRRQRRILQSASSHGRRPCHARQSIPQESPPPQEKAFRSASMRPDMQN